MRRPCEDRRHTSTNQKDTSEDINSANAYTSQQTAHLQKSKLLFLGMEASKIITERTVLMSFSRPNRKLLKFFKLTRAGLTSILYFLIMIIV